MKVCARVNATNTTNVTALMVACRKGHRDAIYLFLTIGADPVIADPDGN